MRFMLTFTWKQTPGEEVQALFPAEQARGRELIEQGISEPALVAADHSTFWAIWHRDSKDDVRAIVDTLPLREHVNVSILALAEMDDTVGVSG